MYLDIIREHGITPNFFMSEEYFRIAGFHERFRSDYFIVYDPDGQIMFPPITPAGKIPMNGKWEIGFPCNEINGELFDCQFIYDTIPDMSDSTLCGGRWKTTRKNIHKVERELGTIIADKTYPFSDQQLQDILLNWTPSAETQIYNPDVIIAHVYKSNNRIALLAKGELVGILIFDTNWKYINFRYCFVKPGIDGLSDYARIFFRMYMKDSPLQINDGGSLGRESLYRYKKRLNPVEIQYIRSNL